MVWYLYIVEASDKSLYTGITKNINRRLQQHNKGTGAKSLLGKKPVKLQYIEQFENQSDAMKREREIKGWNRNKKLELIVRHLQGP